MPAARRAGFSVILPHGEQENVAWVRNYEAEFADTYWLESPLARPRGSRLRVEAGAECRVELKIGAPLHEGLNSWPMRLQSAPRTALR